MITKEGTPFWTLPKRPPTPIEFNPLSKTHQDFIAATSCLYAKVFKVQNPFENPREHKSKEKMADIASQFEIEEFKIDEKKAKEISKEVQKEEEKKLSADADD